MNQIIGETITAIKFENEYYDQPGAIGFPCFKFSSFQLELETASDKRFLFYPTNEKVDYELGLTMNGEQNEQGNSVANEEQWESIIGKKIISVESIRDEMKSLIGLKVEFDENKTLFVMCADYEYNETIKDFTIIPGTSGIIVLFDYECYKKYFNFLHRI